jgi:hypothetical protein
MNVFAVITADTSRPNSGNFAVLARAPQRLFRFVGTVDIQDRGTEIPVGRFHDEVGGTGRFLFKVDFDVINASCAEGPISNVRPGRRAVTVVFDTTRPLTKSRFAILVCGAAGKQLAYVGSVTVAAEGLERFELDLGPPVRRTIVLGHIGTEATVEGEVAKVIACRPAGSGYETGVTLEFNTSRPGLREGWLPWWARG